MALELPKGSHGVCWDKKKINDFWEFYGNQKFKEGFAGELASGVLINDTKKYFARTQKILEIGFGTGAFLDKIAKKGYKCYGIDLSKKLVQNAKKRFSTRQNIVVRQGEIAKIPFENESFDIIFVFEVFEHLLDEDLRKGLEEIKRCLVNGGFLIATVPYKEDIEKSMIICPECRGVFHRVQHLRTFDENNINELLKKDFKVVKMSPFHLGLPKSYIERVAIRLYRLVKGIKAESWLIIAKKIGS